MGFIKRLWQTGVVGTFFAGLLVLLPLAVTLIILEWMVAKIAGIIGPGSAFGSMLASGGDTIVGQDHETLAFFIGLAVALGIIWAIGLVVKGLARQRLTLVIDSVMNRLPVIRAIYKPVAQVVRLLSDDGGKDIKTMEVVSCRFGGEHGVDLLGLATSSRIYHVGGAERKLIYVPTSPLPMSGGLMFVPLRNIVALPEMSVDELLQVYLSLGVVVPDSLKLSGTTTRGSSAAEDAQNHQ